MSVRLETGLETISLTLTHLLLEGFQHCNFPVQVHCQNLSSASFMDFLPYYDHVPSVVLLLLFT